MKKLFFMKNLFIKSLAILIICLSIVFCCCKQETQVDAGFFPKESMFVVVESATNWKIVYHKETKVMYAVSSSRYNYGNFTLLVDENGMPLLWQGE